MAQQTAVEWFFDKLKNHEIQAEHFELYQQAKQMEKEQIMQSYNDGKSAIIQISNNKSLEQYYNEMYKK